MRRSRAFADREKESTVSKNTSSSSSNNNNNSMEAELIEHLNEISSRMRRNDPEFRHLEPISSLLSTSTNTALLLEHAGVNTALTECWQACMGNRHVHTVTLTALPESELRRALRFAQSLQNLKVCSTHQTPRSQSLTVDTVRDFAMAHMPIPSLQRAGLVSLKLDVRIAVHTQAQLDALADSLRMLVHLEQLQLHLLPRCSIQEPTISIHPLLQALADLATSNSRKLRSVQLSLGYEHNPYTRPMIRSTNVLEQLLSSSSQPSSLERLQIDNFGLRNEHLEAVTRALRTNRVLRHLQLARNHPDSFAVATVQKLCRVLASRNGDDGNATLESCVLWTADECRRRQPQQHGSSTATAANAMRLQQEHLHMWCLLNRLGRQTTTATTTTLLREARMQSSNPQQPQATEDGKGSANKNKMNHWWSMIHKASNIGNRRRGPRSPLEDNLLSVAQQETETASSRYSLGAVYTLIRSHPQLIVGRTTTTVAAVSITRSRMSDKTVPPHVAAATNSVDSKRSAAAVPLATNATPTVHTYSLRSSRRRLQQQVTPPLNGKKKRRQRVLETDNY